MALRLIGGPNAAAMLQGYNGNKIKRDIQSLAPLYASGRLQAYNNRIRDFQSLPLLSAHAMKLDVLNEVQSWDFQSLGPLHVAAYLGQLHLIEILIAQPTEKMLKSKSLDSASDLGRLIDCSDDFGNTPLVYAMTNNAEMVALALLQTKAVNPSVDRKTILRWASKRDDKSLLIWIVHTGTANLRLSLRKFGQQSEIYLECDPIDGEKEHSYEFSDHTEVKIAGPWKTPSHTFPLKSFPNSLEGFTP